MANTVDFDARSQPDPGDVGTLSTDRLESEIAELSAQIYAATCRWLELVAEFDRRGAHEESGFHSCALWLSWRCGVAPRAAREHVRVARALPDLPLIRASFGRGELSYSKVRALARVAEPATEADLLELARHATAVQTERIVRAYRGAITTEEANQAHERRFFSTSWEEDGSLSFRGRLDAEEGALLLRALEAGFDALRAREEPHERSADAADAGGPAGPRPPAEEITRADALVEVCESSLTSTAARSGGDRHQIVVHVDEAVLAGGAAAAGHGDSGRAELENGPPLAAEAARRLACDASVVELRERDGEPLSVGRKTRTVPSGMRRALRARDGGCRFPGCTNHRFTDSHHIHHWAHGGETALPNLVEVCRRHHRLLHEGGFTCEPDAEGALVFRRPDGRPLPASPAVPRDRPRGAEVVRVRNRRSGLRIDSGTCTSLSHGEPFDLDLTIDGLCRGRVGRAGRATDEDSPSGPAP